MSENTSSPSASFDETPEEETSHADSGLKSAWGRRNGAARSDSEAEAESFVWIPHERLQAIDEKFYRKQGFYCALAVNQAPEIRFEQALDQVDVNRWVELNCLDDERKHTVSFINDKIQYIEKQLGREEKALDEHWAKPARLNKERDELQKSIATIKKKIREIHQKLAQAKRDLVEGKLKARLAEVRTELDELADNYTQLSDKRHALQKKSFQENKTVHQKIVEQLEKRRKIVEEIYQDFRDRKRVINNAGLTDNAIRFLNFVGVASLLAAGWFYASFLVNRANLNNEDYFSFIFRRIFLFGDTTFGQGGLLQVFLVFLVVWIVLLGLVTLVAWLCQWLLDRENQSNDDWLSISMTSLPDGNNSSWLHRFWINRNPPRRSSKGPRTLYMRWISALPWLFLLGLVFMLLTLFSYGSDRDDVEKLLTSLSGEFVGTLIALAAAGMATLYLSFVVEPRWKKQNYVSSWRVHDELIVTVVLFMGLGLVMTFLDLTQDPTIATLSFFVIVLFTAFTLGYGVKYRGLYIEERNLRSHLGDLDQRIAYHSGFRPLDDKALDGKAFRKKREQCLDELFDLIRTKNTITGELLGDILDNQPQQSPRPPSRLAQWIRKRLGSEHEPEVIALTPSSLEERYFPELAYQIGELIDEWKQQQAERLEIVQELKRIENRESKLEEVILKKIKGLRSSLHNYHRALSEQQRLWNESREAIQLKYWTIESDLRDGFDLGLTYVRSQVGLVGYRWSTQFDGGTTNGNATHEHAN